jgi:excisionase family DNA binding protein
MAKTKLSRELEPLRAEVHALAVDLRAELRKLAEEMGLSLARTLTPKQAAGRLGVSTRTLWRMVANRELKTVRVGQRQMVPVDELDRLSTPKAASPYRRRPRDEAEAALASLRSERPPRKKRTSGMDAVGTS